MPISGEAEKLSCEGELVPVDGKLLTPEVGTGLNVVLTRGSLS